MSEPIPAATVVLTRPAPGGVGLEVLLTRRPASMAFAPDMHVFPGGRVDAADADPRLLARGVAADPNAIAAIREAFEEVGILLGDIGRSARGLAEARATMLAGDQSFLDVVEAFEVRLRTDLLVPLSRWVTPPPMPRRFDARFFVAPAPAGVEVTLVGDEVVEHGWYTPRGALDAMAAGGFGMWAPTSATLQQLEHVADVEEVRTRLAPLDPAPQARVEVEDVAADVVRIRLPAGGGVAGQPIDAYLVGRQRFVLVDPGDSTGAGAGTCCRGGRRERGGAIAGIALTCADPDHVAGAEGLAGQFDVPVFGGPGVGRDLPFDPTEVGEGSVIEVGDVALRVVETPGRGRITSRSSSGRERRPDVPCSVATSGACAARGPCRAPWTRPREPGPWQDSVPWRPRLPGSPPTPRPTTRRDQLGGVAAERPALRSTRHAAVHRGGAPADRASPGRHGRSTSRRIRCAGCGARPSRSSRTSSCR